MAGAAAAGPLRATLLIVILVHAAGTFAYMTLWRTAFAADFDVNDFKAYYTGALALSEGRPDLLYPDAATLNLGVLPDQPWVRFAIERGIPHPSGYIYPPFLAVALRPLAGFSYHRANLAWLALNSLLFAAGVILLVTLRPGGADLVPACGIVFASFCFYPTFRAFQCGQVSILIFFLLTGALWCLERDRQAAAGSLVAVAAAVKLTPAILIFFFLAARRRRAALWAALAGIAAFAVSILGAGWRNQVTFVRDFLPALSRGAATFANQSLAGALNRLFLDTTMNVFEFISEEPGWLKALTRVAALVLLAASLFLARRMALHGGDAAAGYALVVLASLIASPISWEHHFILALIPIAVLILGIREQGAISYVEVALLSGGYVLLATNAYDLIRRFFPYALGRIAISYAFFGAVLLWVLIALRKGGEGPLARRPGGEAAAPAPAGAGIAT
jgi:alpha-1,2-mannosyltransferase